MDSLKNITLFDDPNKYAREAGIEVIVHGYQEYSITKNNIVPLSIDKSLSRKQQLVERYFEPSFIKNKSVLDLGANGGFFDFWAEQNGALKITALDIDDNYLANIEKVKSILGFEKVYTIKTNVQEWNESADVVLAFALVHWLYSCTSSFGSLESVIDKLASLTNNLLIVEWIAPEDPAIQFFKHTDFNSEIVSKPYSLKTFEKALKNRFSKVEILAEVTPTRIVYVAFKAVDEITVFENFPLIEPKENIISSHSLGEEGGNKILSCIYRKGKNVLKQTSNDLAIHEGEILRKFDSRYFPKFIKMEQHKEYSTLEMEWIDGKPLSKSQDEIASSPKKLKSFLYECLNILMELKTVSVKHRDIIIENVIVRNSLPVLIDFGWAEENDDSYITPQGLGNEGRLPDGTYCDVYAIGKLFARLIPKDEKMFRPLIKMMTETDTTKRITNIDDLKSKLSSIEMPDVWLTKPEFNIYSWSWAFPPIESTKYFFDNGFYADENGERWMSEKGQIILPPTSEAMLFNFIITCSAIGHYNKSPLIVNLCDGEEIVDQLMFNEDSEEKLVSLKIPESETKTIIDIVSEDYFVPFEIGINEDTRKLSVRLSKIELIPDISNEFTNLQENELVNEYIFQPTVVPKKELNLPTLSDKKINLAASLLRQADHSFYSNNINEAEFLLRKALSYIKSNPEFDQQQMTDIEKANPDQRFLYNIQHNLDAYEEWLLVNEMTEEDFNNIVTDCEELNYRPLISILTPVYNVDPKWLISCVYSVLSQIYSNWELYLVDDGSTNKDTLNALKQIEKLDSRIKVKYEKTNRGISAATNIALSIANGEFIALLDNDDELTIDALYEVTKLLNQHKEADFIYSDEDKLDTNGKRCEPFFKPDWSLELFRSYSYTCHISIFRKSIIEKVGGFQEQFSGAQDYDITLRVIEKTKNIFHIPKILYHWRKIPGSAADVIDAKGWALIAAKKVLEEHLVRSQLDAEVMKSETIPGCFRVRYKIKELPLVSILLPTRGQMSGKADDELLFKCIHSVVSKTDYSNYEIVVGYNNKLDIEIKNFLKSFPHRAVNYKLKGQFNFANKINFMARQAKGEHLVIFNDDLEVISPEWLSALLEFSQQKEIGVVGSKLLFPNGRLQHVGMVLGINGYPAHIFHNAKQGYPGYRGDANLIRNYSAVTGAGMMVKKNLFNELHGLDEIFRIDYNDTDFCMRVMEMGYRNVYTPYSLFYHHESTVLSDGRLNQKETERFQKRWKKYLTNDPYYNPNLTRRSLDYSLDICPI